MTSSLIIYFTNIYKNSYGACPSSRYLYFLLYMAIDHALAALVPEDAVAAGAVPCPAYRRDVADLAIFNFYHCSVYISHHVIYAFIIIYIAIYRNYGAIYSEMAELMAISAMLEP